jgi:hypothetical protein
MKIVLIGSLIVFFAVYFVFRHIIGSTQGWARISGEVVRSDVKMVIVSLRGEYSVRTSPYERFQPDVQYRYSLRGQTFSSDGIFPRVGANCEKRGEAEAIAARFPVGATVPVYIREGSGGIPLGSSWGACLAHLVASFCDRFRDSPIPGIFCETSPERSGHPEQDLGSSAQRGPIACLVPDHDMKRRDAIFAGVFGAAIGAIILVLFGGCTRSRQSAAPAPSAAVAQAEQPQTISEPALPWRGIVIQAPAQIIRKYRAPAPPVPVIGFYRIGADASTQAGLMLFVRDVRRNVLLSFRVTFDNDPSPVAPPPPHQAMDPKLLEGVTTASHFSLDLGDYIKQQPANAVYEVYMAFAGMRSNTIQIQFRRPRFQWNKWSVGDVRDPIFD